ncbi:hypothetical protein BH09ACT5_BH09ACT5_22010 [soil metagenome]
MQHGGRPHAPWGHDKWGHDKWGHDKWNAQAWEMRDLAEELALRERRQFRMSDHARLAIPVVVSFLIQVPAALFFAVRAPSQGGWIAVLLAIIGPLALLLRRRFPGPVVAFVAAAACADFILSSQSQGPPFVALAFAVILALAHGARLWAWISVGVFWIGTVTVGLLLGYDWHPARIAITTLGLLVTFGIGEAMRTRR